jgi:polyhydroxyalkanoate synthesis regulator phasin
MRMGNRRRHLLVLLPLAALAGCQGADRDLQQELLNLKNETTLQLELLSRHSEFLTEKTDMVEKRLDTLSDADRKLSHDVAVYTARPDQIRKEILDEVDSRGEMAAERQQRFGDDLTGRLDARGTELSNKASTTIAEFQSVLDHEHDFFKFVFTAQDSLNQVFANRFADRPWYESVLGRWEARQSATP